MLCRRNRCLLPIPGWRIARAGQFLSICLRWYSGWRGRRAWGESGKHLRPNTEVACLSTIRPSGRIHRVTADSVVVPEALWRYEKRDGSVRLM
jgi:hypothetical protein